MLLIPCPYCGARAQVEFAYGGDATRQRPPDGAPDEAWYDYVYLRGNPRGPHREWWLHHGGCGQWIRVTRDTATHAVLGAEPAVDPPEDRAVRGGPDGGAVPGNGPRGGRAEGGDRGSADSGAGESAA